MCIIRTRKNDVKLTIKQTQQALKIAKSLNKELYILRY
jgi:hypothetical protein